MFCCQKYNKSYCQHGSTHQIGFSESQCVSHLRTSHISDAQPNVHSKVIGAQSYSPTLFAAHHRARREQCRLSGSLSEGQQ